MWAVEVQGWVEEARLGIVSDSSDPAGCIWGEDRRTRKTERLGTSKTKGQCLC